jgi:hypothetical protein
VGGGVRGAEASSKGEAGRQLEQRALGRASDSRGLSRWAGEGGCLTALGPGQTEPSQGP